MNYTVRDVALTQEEFDELGAILGEHRRICREQNTSEVGNHRYQLSEDLIYKLITEVKIKNTYTK